MLRVRGEAGGGRGAEFLTYFSQDNDPTPAVVNSLTHTHHRWIFRKSKKDKELRSRRFNPPPPHPHPHLPSTRVSQHCWTSQPFHGLLLTRLAVNKKVKRPTTAVPVIRLVRCFLCRSGHYPLRPLPINSVSDRRFRRPNSSPERRDSSWWPSGCVVPVV